jgi:hypothetical protein
VLANDSDADGNPITALLEIEAHHGMVALNEDGSFLYTPEPGFGGTDFFVYRPFDALGAGNPTHVLIFVNRAPVAVDDDYEVATGGVLVVPAPGVLDNDSDPDFDPLTALVEVDPAHGMVVMNPDGSFTYTPAPGFMGTDTFGYRAFDALVSSNPATVTITVGGIMGG